MKRQLIKAIQDKIDSLDDEDVNGILYWNTFRKFVKNFKAEPVKKKPLQDRKDVFLKELHTFKEKFDSNMLNAFWKYWTEHNTNGKLMRFEYRKNQPFNMGRRLGTWKSNQKDKNKGHETRIDKLQSAFDKDLGGDHVGLDEQL